MYEKIKKWHRQGLWNTLQVENAAKKGILREEQVNEILQEKGN